MAQQITNNNLIPELLSTSTNYVDSSANQFDNILDIANKSVLKQNETINTNLNTKDSKTNTVTSTTTTNIPANQNTVGSVNNNQSQLNATKTNNNYSANSSNYSTVTKPLPQQAGSASVTESNVDVKDNAELTTDIKQTIIDTTSDDNVDEDITIQVENLIQAYSMNKLDLSTLKLHFPEDLGVLDADIDADVDTDILDMDIEAVDTELNINLDSMVDDTLLETDIENLDETVVNTDETLDYDNVKPAEAAVITPVNINLSAQYSTESVGNDIQTDVNSIMFKVSNEVEPLQEKYFLPKEKPVNDILTQDMVDELNITIEDMEVSSDVQYDETSFDSLLMDSTEQVVKYSMEKADEDVQSFSKTDIKVTNDLNQAEDMSYEEIVDTGVAEVEVEESVDTKKEIKTSDNEIELEADTDESEITVSEEIDYSFSEDEFQSESETKQDAPVLNKQTSSREVERDVRKEYADVEVSVEESVTTDEAISNPSSVSGMEHTSTMNVHSSSAMDTSSQTFASTNISKEDVIAQIHAKLQSMNSQNTKLTMVLNPESLGKVSIQLMNTKSGMVAEMVVASQNVKEILDSNLSNLKETLTAQGVQVNEVSVKVAESENNAEMDYTEQEGSDSGKGEHQRQQRHKEKDENKFEKMVSDLEKKNKN